MINFTPDSIVHLCSTPLERDYKNQLYFKTRTAQETYFLSTVVHTYTGLTYQRADNIIRVESVIDDLYDCNYVMYKNSNYGDRWFYAFITDMQYVNPNLTYVTIETDVIQTWLLDTTIMDSFVVREHVSNDAIGANTQPESVELGPYIKTAISFANLSPVDYYLFSTEVLPVEGVSWHPPGQYGGSHISCYWIKFDIEQLKSIIDNAAQVGKENAIISIFAFPQNAVLTDYSCIANIGTVAPRTLEYSPKNNKLYTYPYCALLLEGSGVSVELRYELLKSQALTCFLSFGPNTTAIAFPDYASGSNIADIRDFEHGVEITGWPVLPWVGNYYQNWIAYNGPKMLINMGSTMIGAVSSIGITPFASDPEAAFGGSAVGAFGSVAKANLNNLAQKTVAQMVPNSIHGNVAAVEALAANNGLGVKTTCMTIRPEYARIIDDYFSMFGYSVNRIKKPNLGTRQNWNYVETQNVILSGDYPDFYMDRIKQCFNSGITFWNNPTTYGDYTQPNGVVT